MRFIGTALAEGKYGIYGQSGLNKKTYLLLAEEKTLKGARKSQAILKPDWAGRGKMKIMKIWE